MPAAPSICPHCGVDVPRGASSCPGCGSDHQTGWSAEAGYAHLLPDDRPLKRSRRVTWVVGLIAIAVTLALVSGMGLVRSVFWLIALAAALLIGLYVLATPRRGVARRRAEAALERLVALCYNDREMAARLIEAEARRAPGLDRAPLIERAIDRLRDDRRR